MTTLKDAVYQVMLEAYAVATGDGRLRSSDRTLYYQVRSRIQAFTDKPLEYGYFQSDVLVQYQRDFEPLPLLYRDPRGELHEPHTGNSVRLGTREVEVYVTPNWTYDKVLYVEKEGLGPVLLDADLSERYDMAIITGTGYAVTAAKTLLSYLTGRFFVLHDADPAGYNIARTLGGSTWRMPDHSLDVADLGLTVAEAKARGLQTEEFSPRKEIPKALIPRLTDEEKDWFCRPNPKIRVELNAFTGPDLVAYIEGKLAEHDATAKLVPPQDVIDRSAELTHEHRVREALEDALADLIDRDALTVELADATRVESPSADDVRTYVEREANRGLWWSGAVARLLLEVPDLAKQASVLLNESLNDR
jgi:hypothetical protein